jgi:hypothetical protein
LSGRNRQRVRESGFVAGRAAEAGLPKASRHPARDESERIKREGYLSGDRKVLEMIILAAFGS